MATVVIPPQAAAQSSTESQVGFTLPNFDVEINPPWTIGSIGETEPEFAEETGITEWTLVSGSPGTEFQYYLNFETNWHFYRYALTDENGDKFEAEVDINGHGSLGYNSNKPHLVRVSGVWGLDNVTTAARPFTMSINPTWQPNASGRPPVGFTVITGITSWRITSILGVEDTYALTFFSTKDNWGYKFTDMAGNSIPTKHIGPQYFARYTSKGPALIKVTCTPA